MPTTTLRARFTKTGDAAYISLLDLQRVMQRALKRSGLPVWYTLGFNPHIYMTFAAPLALGQESLVECVDFKSEAESFDWSAAAPEISACLPRGIVVTSVAPAQQKPDAIALARYRITYENNHAQEAQSAFAAFDAMEKAPVLKKGKHHTEKELDLKTLVQVEHIVQENSGAFCVELLSPAGNVLTINPALVLGVLEEQCGLQAAAGTILRTALLTQSKENFV